MTYVCEVEEQHAGVGSLLSYRTQGSNMLLGLVTKHSFLLSPLAGPRYSVSQVSFRSLHFF